MIEFRGFAQYRLGMSRAVVLLLFVLACGKNERPPPPLEGVAGQESGPRGKPPRQGAPPAGTAVSAAHNMFMTVCAACHGPDGTGTGPAAESLNPRPRNYTDAAWQASVTDDDIKKIIVEGGQANGKSAMMPANPQLRDQPEVVDGLVQIIRGFGKK